MRAFLLRRLLRDKSGNIAIITALAAVPMFFLAGMGVDYGLAQTRKSQLDSFADAAALAAVTPTMMAQNTSAAQTVAKNTFAAQASQLSRINYQNATVDVQVSTAGSVRTVNVNYVAPYNLVFPNLLGLNTIQVAGNATATSGIAPNIDFYLLLDTSPSMAIAATQAGINTMVSNTSHQGGCAFGCHESNPAADNLGNPHGEDNYALARSLGVILRIDLLSQAAQNLMGTAATTEATYHTTYRMAINTFDVGFHSIQALTANLTTAQNAAVTIAQLQVYDNNCLTQSNCNNDQDTDFQKGMSSVNGVMPNPGTGTGKPGDTPQEVLFIVTDGVVDAHVNSDPGYTTAYGTYCCSGRQQSTINPRNSGGNEVQTNWCTTIKNRGIRIAMLYTEYLPLPTNDWYNSKIASFQPNIAGQLRSCASPGLFYEVTTGGDISAAMASLFKIAVQSAYLSR